MQLELLMPLGLDNTGYHARDRIVDRMARGYVRRLDGYAPEDYVDVSVPYAAGMMFSTVGDMHKWKRKLHTGGVFEDPSSFESMITPHDGAETGYGYGISMVSRQFGDKTLEFTAHGGRIEGFRIEDMYVPGKDWTIIVMSNVKGRPEIIARNLTALLMNQPIDRMKRPVMWDLANVIANEGINAGIARYRDLKQSGSDRFDMSEYQLNALGYYFMARSEIDNAIPLFELNAKVFPESSNAYDSLGESYRAAGRFDDSLASYRRALTLNPSNENAAKMIEQVIELSSTK